MVFCFKFTLNEFSGGKMELLEGVTGLVGGQTALGIIWFGFMGAEAFKTGETEAVLGETGVDGGFGLVGDPAVLGGLDCSFLTARGTFSSASVAAGTIVVGWTLLVRARYRLVPP